MTELFVKTVLDEIMELNKRISSLEQDLRDLKLIMRNDSGERYEQALYKHAEEKKS